MDHRAVQQPVQIGGIRTVPAHQSVIAENPDISCLGHRVIRWLWRIVWIHEARSVCRRQDLLQCIRVEPEDVEIKPVRLQFLEFDRQDLEVPLCDRGGLIVGDSVRSQLLRRKVRGDVDRHASETELLGRLPPSVSADNHPI